MEIEFGNASSIDTNGTGWFLGFSDWTRPDPGGIHLRYLPEESRSHGLCMKWTSHSKGDPRGLNKPISTGRTISILVSEAGRFRLQFCEEQDFPQGRIVEHVLVTHGDFVVWGDNLYHRWMVDANSTILTLRWVPEVMHQLNG